MKDTEPTGVATKDSAGCRRLDFIEKDELIGSKQPAFLEVHLKLLRALYADESADASMDALVFVSIESFLKNRQRLLRGKEESLRLKGVHQQVCKVADAEQRQRQIASNNSDQAAASRKRKSVSPRHASPMMLSFSMQSPLMMMHGETTREPFGLVARLLQSRSHGCHQQFQQEVVTFKPLLEAAKQEIAKLEQQLAQTRSARNVRTSQALEGLLSTSSPRQLDVTDTTESSVLGFDLYEQSLLAEASYKVKLWSVLAGDLDRILFG